MGVAGWPTGKQADRLWSGPVLGRWISSVSGVGTIANSNGLLIFCNDILLFVGHEQVKNK